MKQFKTLLDLLDTFKSEADCKKYMVKLRWEDRILCPHCDGFKIYKFSDGLTYKCGHCRKKFNCKTGTFMEGTKIPMRKWFAAIYLAVYHKKGVSSCQLAKDINVTQKTAWFMLQRIRQVFVKQRHPVMTGVVQCDETYVGGKNKNRHRSKKIKNSQGRSYKDKTPVFGILQEGGHVDAMVVPDVQAWTLNRIINQNVQRNSTIVTDEWHAYNPLGLTYEHYVLEHGKGQYAVEGYSTNALEGFWSHLKRGILGIYHNVSRKHLDRYVKEFVFRYNHRKFTAQEAFNKFLTTSYHRLKYKDLIA